MAKSIPLTQGKFALVDDEDFEYLNQYKWQISNNGYAVRQSRINGGNPKTILMHREIISPDTYLYVDHVNMDKLDNRRKNLRVCSNSQNQRNRKKQPNNSGYKGVFFYKEKKKWRASIWVDGKPLYLGLFESPELAANAYDEEAKKYFGEFARINFPVEAK